VLAGEAAVRDSGAKPLARLVAYGHAGVDPVDMGIGPVPASRAALSGGSRLPTLTWLNRTRLSLHKPAPLRVNSASIRLASIRTAAAFPWAIRSADRAILVTAGPRIAPHVVVAMALPPCASGRAGDRDDLGTD
jgi:hypothetical protein